MSTPTVTEMIRRPEPVRRDPFIDDLRRVGGAIERPRRAH